MEVFLIKALQFLLAISLLVLLHELGHFTFAKLFKVRVSKFYLFFNPKFHIVSTYDTWVRRLLRLKPETVPTRKDEDGNEKKEYVGTEYGLGWLPMGGYCAIDGMIDETNQKLSKEVKPWEFRAKPAWQRLLIMVGGVLVNFLLALFIYSMVLFYWGDAYVPLEKMTQGMEFNEQAKALGFQDGDILLSTDEGPFKGPKHELGIDVNAYRQITNAKQVYLLRNGQKDSVAITTELSLLDMGKTWPPFMRTFVPAVIDSVLPQMSAAEAGLQKGDRIVMVNGKTITSYNQFTDEIVRINEEMHEVKTHGDSLALRQMTLAYERDGRCDTVSVMLNEQLKLGFVPRLQYEPDAIRYGFFESFPAGISYGWNVLSSYVDDLKYLFTADGAKSLGGFGAIGSLFPDTWDWHRFWLMTAFLSIILAFMNILPIPALDGGHVLFLLYEMITRRKPSENFLIKAEYIGFGAIILLMVVANLNDILRWLGVM
jgi:regulator of sigma E protease